MKRPLSDKLFKFQLVLLFSGMVLFSCGKEYKDLPGPIREIIAKSKNCGCDPYIDRYTWRGNKVYLEGCGGAACNCFAYYFDADGQRLTLDQASQANFSKEASDRERVWQCH